MKNKLITIRKPHFCESCNCEFPKGTKMLYVEYRNPVYEINNGIGVDIQIDQQIGIEYVKVYNCEPCLNKE